MRMHAQACQQWLQNRFIFALLFLILIFSFSTAFAALGPNLIINPSLESGTTSPTSWTSVKSGTATVSFSYPVAGFSSAKAAQVNVTAYTSGDEFWQPPNAPVTAGQQYQFTGYSNSTVAVPVIATYLKNGSAASYQLLGTAAGTNTWQPFSANVTIPTGITEVRIQHVLQSVGTMAIDNYALQLINSSPAQPTCALSASPASIQAGSTSTLIFTSTNATGGTIDNNVGAVGTSGTTVVSPTATTLYTATFTGSGGTISCSANVTVTATPSPNLIQNGNLETADPAGPSIPLNWASSAWNATATFTYPVAGKGGGKAAKLAITRLNADGGAT